MGGGIGFEPAIYDDLARNLHPQLPHGCLGLGSNGRANIERHGLVYGDSLESLHLLKKPPSLLLGEWIDGSEDMPLDYEGKEADEDMRPDSAFREVEDRLNESYPIEKWY